MRPSRDRRPVIDSVSLSLDKWLELISVPEDDRGYLVADHSFATDLHREEYLLTVHERSEDEIRTLLRRFLISSGSLGVDRLILKGAVELHGNKFIDKVREIEFLRRTLATGCPWEGITWILDLLPDQPRRAVEILQAYFSAHAQFLPDGRIHGLDDCEAIIYQRYLQKKNSNNVLLDLSSTEFEFLVAALFEQMGYEVAVTPPGADGGIDITAKSKNLGRTETVLIQCKRYTGRIGVPKIRELWGVVSATHANKGIIVSTSDFTKQAHKETVSTPTIELIGFEKLNLMMNEHFGSRWPTFVTYHIGSAKRQSEMSNTVPRSSSI